MIRLLPFILIPLLILGGLGYFRYVSTHPKLEVPQAISDIAPIEVPKTLPQASVEERLKILEDLASKIVVQINALKSSVSASSSADASIIELKARVSALEKGSPQTSTSSKSTIYIPLGSGGQINDTNWVSLNTFQVSLDPSQYPGYLNMQLEVTMRLNQPGGTLFARLYNQTSGSAISSEVTTTSTTSNVQTSATFTLPTGSKNYILQAKTSDGNVAFLDYARIKVNF